MRYKPKQSYSCKLIITAAAVSALHKCLSPEIKRRHEGITYLLGRTDGITTLAVTAMRPQAQTSFGSFHVSSVAMARVVRAAADYGLQVIGQVHTHPHAAFHSDGDIDGTLIAYSGYVSIVLPDYGCHLPSFDGAAYFAYIGGAGFSTIDPADIVFVPGRVT